MNKLVTSLELSKRLHALGVKCNTHFKWFPQIGFYEQKLVSGAESSEYAVYERMVVSSVDDEWYVSNDPKEEYRPNIIPAFTSSELGEMLPPTITHDGTIMLLRSCKNTFQQWHIEYYSPYPKLIDDRIRETTFCFVSDTEAESRGLMLEYLVKNKLIKII